MQGNSLALLLSPSQSHVIECFLGRAEAIHSTLLSVVKHYLKIPAAIHRAHEVCAFLYYWSERRVSCTIIFILHFSTNQCTTCNILYIAIATEPPDTALVRECLSDPSFPVGIAFVTHMKLVAGVEGVRVAECNEGWVHVDHYQRRRV